MSVTARRLRACLLCLVPASVFAQQTREFGAASFVPPAGWTVDSRPEFQRFTRVQGQHLCMVAISAEEPLPGSLDMAFARMWTSVFNPNSYRRADRPNVVEQVSPTGFRHAFGEGDVEDRGGNRMVARLHVFPVGQKTQSVVFLGNSRAALDDCRQDWAAFFASLRFRSISPETQAAADPRPGPPTASPPTAPPRASSAPARPNERSNGAPETFDNITFVPPVGWSVRRASGVVEVAPTDTRGMEALQVLVLSGRRFSGTLATDFESGWAEVQSLLNAQRLTTVNGVPYELQQPTRSLRGTEYLRAKGGMRRADGNYSVDLVVFRVGDRVERAAVVSRDFRDNLVMTTTWNNPVYEKAIRELVFRMKFANQAERPVTAAGLRPGGIVGVWAGLSMSMGEIKTNFAIFFDNGMAYFGPQFPADGLLDIDPVVVQPSRLREWGTYTMTGDAGVITMPYGTIPLRRLGSALELTTNRTPHRFVRFAMPDGPLDGTWCFTRDKCLRLTADSRFEDNGAVRGVEHSTYAFAESPPSGQGRYAIRAHTLVLTYDGGPEIRVGFAGLIPGQRAPSPSELWVGFEPDRLVRR